MTSSGLSLLFSCQIGLLMVINISYYCRYCEGFTISLTSSAISSTNKKLRPTSTEQLSMLSTSNRIQETLDPCVVLMKQLLTKYQYLWDGDDQMYSLAQGIVHWSPPPSAAQAMISAIQEENNDLHLYAPDEGIPELISALKDKFKRENHLPSSDDVNMDIIVTSGANQAYMNCICTLLSEGDKCVIFKPYYFNHVMAIQMVRGNEAILTGPIDQNGYPDIHWLRKQLEHDKHKIKIVTVVNPGNPTGVSIPTDNLRKIVNLCKDYNVWLIMDCTYEHFDHNGSNSFPIHNSDDVGFHCFDDENVINIFSFSKGYGMAGFRVGAVTINTTSEKGRDMYQQMVKVQDTIPICTSKISQLAAIGALSTGRKWVLDKVKSLDTGRELIMDALSSLECCIGGTGAMYIMAKLPDGMDDMVFAETLIEKYGVAIIPGVFVGLPGWIRVCYSNLPVEDCKVAAGRLKNGILDLCNDTSIRH